MSYLNPRTTPTASTSAKRDAQANISADAFIAGFTSTATAAGTTTLAVDGTEIQEFTGATTQTCVLPTTGIVAGQRYKLINASTGSVTVNASGGAGVLTLGASVHATFIARQATPTTAAHWSAIDVGLINGTPTVSAQASTVPKRDAQANLLADAFIASRTSLATAAGTTTLTIDSTQTQVFTGSTTQTVLLPTTSVLAGQSYTVINQSSGDVTVQSSGANTVATLTGAANPSAKVFTALQDTPTTAAHWRAI